MTTRPTHTDGYYFQNLVDELTKRKPEFPTDDPTPNLQQCLDFQCTQPYKFNQQDYYGLNLVRAEMLAKQHNLSPDVIKHLQELAYLQYSYDFRNWEGMKNLVDRFETRTKDLKRIFHLIDEEKVYPMFSYRRETEMSIDESWHETYDMFKRAVIQEVAKPNIISRFFFKFRNLFIRFFNWIRSLFKK